MKFFSMNCSFLKYNYTQSRLSRLLIVQLPDARYPAIRPGKKKQRFFHRGSGNKFFLKKPKTGRVVCPGHRFFVYEGQGLQRCLN
ncbi:MAG: hypothetical protein DRH32_01010 [Deltaproteobacteria bacterium]|nr:MAG: hypothetical protein DRH32_01010 [Deltaproteobacteria bacterium]